MNASNRLSEADAAIVLPDWQQVQEAAHSVEDPEYAEALAAWRGTELPDHAATAEFPEGMDTREAMRQALAKTTWAEENEPHLPTEDEFGI